jgi:hypothetical protein
MPLRSLRMTEYLIVMPNNTAAQGWHYAWTEGIIFNI